MWMFYSRELNTKINNLHYRALRLIYKDNSSTFEKLLRKGRSKTIHQKNIYALVTEMYKVQNNLTPDFMRDISPIMENDP